MTCQRCDERADNKKPGRSRVFYCTEAGITSFPEQREQQPGQQQLPKQHLQRELKQPERLQVQELEQQRVQEQLQVQELLLSCCKR